MEAWEATIPRRARMSDNILSTWESSLELQPCPGNMKHGKIHKFVWKFSHHLPEVLEEVGDVARSWVLSFSKLRSHRTKSGHNQSLWPKFTRQWRATPKLVDIANTWSTFQPRGAPSDLGKEKGCISNPPKLQTDKMYRYVPCQSLTIIKGNVRGIGKQWATPHRNYCTDFCTAPVLASQHALHFPTHACPTIQSQPLLYG